jgi:beta-lactamase regulating signal transducer with metallopeptidase domain
MTPSLIAQLPWVQALGWTLLHFIWQGALVGIVFAVLRALIPAGHCNARYANGLAALVLMLVFPLVTLFTILRADLPVEAVSPAVMAVSTVSAIAQSAPPAALSVMDTALQWIVCLWIAGVLLMAYRSWYQWRSLMQIARKWAQPDAELEAALLALAGRFEFMRRIKVLVSDRIDTPILIGWFKPVILLPTAVVLGFPRQQVELILAHELGHLRRYDHLVNLAQALVETLLFYHPVVHWISREIRNEREICCDTLVLHKTSGDPREYARTLAALEELRQPAPQMALAATGGVLLERVRRILGSQRNVMRRSARWPWLLAVAGTAISLLVAMRVEHREPLQVSGPELRWEQPSLALLDPAGRFAAAPIRLEVISSAQAEEPKPAAVAPPQPEPLAAEATPKAVADATPPPAAMPQIRESALAPADVPAEPERPVVPVPDPTAAAAGDSALAQAPAPEQAPAIAPPPSSADVSAETDPPAPATAPVQQVPVATHTVSPEYPYSFSTRHTERVKLEFGIASDGSVRDVRVMSEQPIEFARAAERALKQWKFARGSFVAAAKKRYAQTFVFASPLGEEEVADSGCERRTGTRLCRRPGESADALAPQEEPKTAEACVKQVGSRVCRGANKLNVNVMQSREQLAVQPYVNSYGG